MISKTLSFFTRPKLRQSRSAPELSLLAAPMSPNTLGSRAQSRDFADESWCFRKDLRQSDENPLFFVSDGGLHGVLV